VDLELSGRTAIVGGASTGLGLAIAQSLAREAANVVMTARRADLLRREADRIGAVAVPGDLSAAEDRARLVDATIDRFGGLDVLVWNTGGPAPSLAVDISPESAQDAFASLLLPLIGMIELAVPHLRASDQGRLIAITAAGVKEPTPNVALSNAIRPGVVGYLKTLSNELAADGVTVNCVAPGRILTSRFEQIYPDGPPAELTREIPARRLGQPRELAEVACFLASARASYVTGTTVTVDGGLTKALL
jgi:3-oxoacyl-[acyl-carrier protein] reductase